MNALFAKHGRQAINALQKWGVILVGLTAVQGATALALIILARRVSSIEFGQYLSSYGLLSLLIVFPNLGLESWLLASGKMTPAETSADWQGALRLRLASLGAWLSLMILLSFWLPQATFPLAVFVPTAFGVAFDSLTLLSNAAWRGLGQHGRVTAIQMAGALALLGATLCAPIAPGQLHIFAWIRMLMSGSIFLFVILLAPQELRSTTPPTSYRNLLKASRPFTLAEISMSVYLKADLTIVSFFLGAPGSSIYGPALNFTNLCFLVSNGLYLFMLPKLSRQFTVSKIKFVRFGLIHSIVQAFAGGFVALAIFGLAPLLIQIVYGPTYSMAGLILRWMSPIIFIKAINFGLGAWLSAGGCQPQRASTQMISALFNVIANLIVVIPLGLGGVVAVYILSEIILLVGYLTHTIRRILIPSRSSSANVS